MDEKTLARAFLEYNGTSPELRETYAEQWFNYHFDNFVQFDDLVKLQQAGVTHLRVPLPHWILGNMDEEDEEWIVGHRWQAFVKVCRWARQLGLQVWPDLHTAPKSQNGFDNSGQSLPYTTCQVWINDPVNVNRSLAVIGEIAHAVVDADLQDVVTGMGLLNEPYADCDMATYRDFIDRGLDIVRATLGADTTVYVSDLFQATNFNDGSWWLDASQYNNTFLDSHYYQVFDETTRALSPRQHIAFTCENHARRATSCCYQDAPQYNTTPSAAVSRMVGEWSASFDSLPNQRVTEVMEGIAQTGVAPYWDRQLSAERQDFLRHYIQAQMVTWEAAEAGTASAWFYWTLKMEGGAFAEWSFLRGVEEGWFPTPLPPPHVPSQERFGTCQDILFRTKDDMSIVHEFPDPTQVWTPSSVVIDDDVVLSHGDSLLRNKTSTSTTTTDTLHAGGGPNNNHHAVIHFLEHWQLPLGALALAVGVVGFRLIKKYCKRSKYSPIGGTTQEVMTINV